MQNALGASGEGGVERYGETLTPVLDVWSLPEWRYLRNERSLLLSGNEPIGAGRSYLGIQNVSRLTVVDFIQNRGASGTLSLTVGFGVTVDSLELSRPLDTRFHEPTLASGEAKLYHRQGAIGGTTTGLGRVYGTQGVFLPVHIILKPGWYLSVDPDVDATAITLTFIVRERTAFRGEL